MFIAIIILGLTGAASALILYWLSKRFEVVEDPRKGLILNALPGANCGGCGYPGCGGFADACVKAQTLDGLLCPAGGAEVMKQVAEIMGQTAAESIARVAVLRCNGACEVRQHTNVYDGAPSCAIAAALYAGETGCSYGCLGLRDCQEACSFGAITMNLITGLPVINEDKCTSCGACVKACPKKIIELRKKGPKSRRIFVACVNKDKGGIARKACANACIGCSKCQKECAFEAITIVDNLAFIDDMKCRLCRKCVAVCPTGSIHEINFPPKKEEPKQNLQNRKEDANI
jgi:Na+-translocating ferredoxin:NAD+ oxidoreductase RNF subunit RnfB